MMSESPEKTGIRRKFIRIQIVKGALGFVLALGYAAMLGRPDAAETAALTGLIAPLGLAWAGTTGFALDLLEAASLALFAVLIASLGVLTGGLVSPFLVWLAVVPFEGALAGRPRSVIAAGLAAGAALFAVGGIEALGLLPHSRLPEPAGPWFGGVLCIAIVQATAMAVAAQRLHRKAVLRDIAARKAHEKELVRARDLALEASRSKSRFLANMSHELRTPLNAIIGFSDVMAQQLFGPVGSARYLEYAGLINESGSHLLELINSILDMSKIEAGRMELSPEEFDLSAVVAQAVHFLELMAQRHGVALSFAVAPDARRLTADKRAVRQMLINLLSNGVKFTPRGGEVRVTTRALAGKVEISVADTGVGIAPEDLKRIGQPFEQVENEHTRSKEGTGLGLALVHSLVQMHGGAMSIESELGEGTVVKIVLPRAVEAERFEEIAA